MAYDKNGLKKYLSLPETEAIALAKQEKLTAAFREISYIEIRDGGKEMGLVFGLEPKSLEDKALVVYDVMIDGKIIYSNNPYRIHYIDNIKIYNEQGRRLYVYYFFDYEEQTTLVGYHQLTQEQLEAVTLKANQVREERSNRYFASLDQKEKSGELSTKDYNKCYDECVEAPQDEDILLDDWERQIVKEFGLMALEREAQAAMRPSPKESEA